MKAAIKDWRHWLEGATHPFQVITDHKNLEYIKGAKRLNLHQARWALFFTHLRFTVTYRVFRVYGLPEDIVSDRGTQFISQFCRAFCKQLDINVSLTSGYHPQANGQVKHLNQEIG